MEDLGIIGGLLAFGISIAVLIVFFVMAANVAKIKEDIEKMDLADNILKGEQYNWHLARREVFKGNKEKAVDYYLNYLYYLKENDKRSLKGRSHEYSIECVKEIITELGGNIPDDSD